MPEDQKERHLHKFHTCPLKEQNSEDIIQNKEKRSCNPTKHITKKGSSSSEATFLGISTQLAQESTNLPVGTILGILEKV